MSICRSVCNRHRNQQEGVNSNTCCTALHPHDDQGFYLLPRRRRRIATSAGQQLPQPPNVPLRRCQSVTCSNLAASRTASPHTSDAATWPCNRTRHA
jgi:hypothetical protein